jgi:hypothetical protein
VGGGHKDSDLRRLYPRRSIGGCTAVKSAFGSGADTSKKARHNSFDNLYILFYLLVVLCSWRHLVL